MTSETSPERQQAKLREFMSLLPLTIELAGLPHSEAGRYYNDGQLEVRATALRTAFKVAAAGFVAGHLDVAPGNAFAAYRTETLHDGLFRGPACGEMFGRVPPRLAEANLFLRINTQQKLFAVLLDHMPDAQAFHNLGADADDAHVCSPHFRKPRREGVAQRSAFHLSARDAPPERVPLPRSAAQSLRVAANDA